MKRALPLCVLFSALVTGAFGVSAPDEYLAAWERFAKTPGAAELRSWMVCVMRDIAAGTACGERLAAAVPPFYGRLGVFVTLMRGGRVRGCFGAFHHASDDIETVLRHYLRGALRYDPRYRPLDISETADTRIILTIAGPLAPAASPDDVDISRCGLMFAFDGGETCVFVPAEIKSRDNLKRMIAGKDIQQCAAFEAVTIR